MQTITMAEAARGFTDLVQKLDDEPVVVMNAGQAVAIISSPDAEERKRRASWDAFWERRDAFAAEFAASLAKDGLTVDEFLADLLKND